MRNLSWYSNASHIIHHSTLSIWNLNLFVHGFWSFVWPSFFSWLTVLRDVWGSAAYLSITLRKMTAFLRWQEYLLCQPTEPQNQKKPEAHTWGYNSEKMGGRTPEEREGNERPQWARAARCPEWHTSMAETLVKASVGLCSGVREKPLYLI